MIREYFISPKNKKFYVNSALILIALRELIIAFALFIAPDGSLRIVQYLLLVFWLFYIVQIIIIAYTQKIVVTPDEIILERVGAFVSIRWSDIQRIDVHHGLRKNQESLFAPKNKIILKGWNGFLYGKEAYIPLEEFFDDNWRDSELGQQIKQYAPGLFQ